MTVTINGTTGIDKVQPGVVTSSSLASGQTLAVNGIAFPSGQVASSDANTLDDYEEGTFTPYLTDGTNSVALFGTYTKIGRVVTIQTLGAYNTNFSSLSASAGLRITGLPFATASDIGPAQWAAFPTNCTAASSNLACYFAGTQMYIFFMNNAVDSTQITRNNLVGGAGTFTLRVGGFSYVAS